MNQYQPISCSLYDELELFAMRGKSVAITLCHGEVITDTIHTFESRKDEGEFAILKSGIEIRLDELEKVGHISMSDAAC